VRSNTDAAVLGAAAAALGATIGVTTRRRPATVAVGACALCFWSVLEVGRVPSTGSTIPPSTLFAVAAIMSVSAVAFLSVTGRALGPRHGPSGRRGSATFGLGYAYSKTAPTQTGIISAMYAVVVFTLCFAVTVAHVYAANVDVVARALGGRAALEVISNAAQPVSAHEVEQLPGVSAVTNASALDVHLIGLSGGSVDDVTIIGITGALIDHGTPPVVTVARDFSSDSLYQQVSADPTLVVVGADLNTTSQSSLDRHAPHVGDRLQLQDPTTGVTRRVRIAALVADANYQGADHIYGSAILATTLHAGPTPRNLLYVETRSGTHNDTLAAIIDATHLANGAYARSFHRLADDQLAAQQQFLDVLAAYTALGLAAGAVAIAVAMTDRVRKRRHQLATLRAIGLRPATLRRALRVEVAIIGLEAALAGILTATLLTWRLATTGALGQPLAFTLPSPLLVLIVILVLLSAFAATTLAARRVAQLQPAIALRGND
jgi:ABC-type lipoprotein release transport system permease subunit